MSQHKYIPWESVELEELSSLLKRQMIVGDQVMLARVLLKKGCVVPRHSHHNEQVTYILDGALKFVLNGEEVVVRTGEVLCIPSNVPHEAIALPTLSTRRRGSRSTISGRLLVLAYTTANNVLSCSPPLRNEPSRQRKARSARLSFS